MEGEIHASVRGDGGIYWIVQRGREVMERNIKGYVHHLEDGRKGTKKIIIAAPDLASAIIKSTSLSSHHHIIISSS